MPRLVLLGLRKRSLLTRSSHARIQQQGRAAVQHPASPGEGQRSFKPRQYSRLDGRQEQPYQRAAWSPHHVQRDGKEVGKAGTESKEPVLIAYCYSLEEPLSRDELRKRAEVSARLPPGGGTIL